MADFKTQGKLEELDFRKMVDNISLFDMTGSLDIRPTNSNDIFNFIFVNGSIRFINDNSENPGKYLGTILQKSGIITREQLAECSSQKEITSRPLGEIILSKRYASQQDIIQMLHRQVEDVLLSIAMCTNGNFYFNARAKIPQDPFIDLNLSNAELVNRYYMVQREWNDIKDEVPPLNSLIMRDNELIEMAQPNDTEKEILNQLAKPLPLNVVLDGNIHCGKLSALKLLVSLINRQFIKVGAVKQDGTTTNNVAAPQQNALTLESTKSFLTTKRTRFSSFIAELASMTIIFFAIIFLLLSPLPEIIRILIVKYTHLVAVETTNKTSYSKTIEALRIASFTSPANFSSINFVDGWGTPLKIIDKHIVSAGEDTEFGTDDDIRISL